MRVEVEQYSHDCTQRTHCETGFFIKKNPTSPNLDRVCLCEYCSREPLNNAEL